MEIQYEMVEYKAISGFAFAEDMLKVLNIYNRGPGLAPPQFVFIQHEPVTRGTGYYVGMSASLKKEDLEELKKYLRYMEVHEE